MDVFEEVSRGTKEEGREEMEDFEEVLAKLFQKVVVFDFKCHE